MRAKLVINSPAPLGHGRRMQAFTAQYFAGNSLILNISRTSAISCLAMPTKTGILFNQVKKIYGIPSRLAEHTLARDPRYCYNRLKMSTHPAFTDVPDAIEEIRAGRMIVVVDDEDRENEGDRPLAAEKVTPEAINFMAKFGRGLVCLAMTEERLEHLRIGPMTAENTSQYGTAFCEAIDARQGVTTGISAYDRARTIQVAIDPATKPADLARPGHVFPLRARKGGVLVRAGQTEASVDLARLAGMVPAGIICEIMKDDGSMARVPDLIGFCRE